MPRPTKDKRLAFRVDPELRSLLQAAAAAERRTLSDFVRDVLTAAALATLEASRAE